MDIESSCTKTNSLIETLTEEILAAAALKETEIQYQYKPDQKSMSG